jgi:hypothetical protein
MWLSTDQSLLPQYHAAMIFDSACPAAAQARITTCTGHTGKILIVSEDMDSSDLQDLDSLVSIFHS